MPYISDPETDRAIGTKCKAASFRGWIACYFQSAANLILFAWIVTVHPEEFQDSGE